jgi:ribonuclease III
MTPEQLELAQTRIGHRFADPSILVRAFTHASTAESRQASNERLEFLGDAVLGLVCCEMVFQAYPEYLEGEMTKIKSTVVSRQTCAAMAKQLQIDELLLIGKGMQGQRALPQSLGAATLEAAVAAIYLDAGMDAARGFLVPLLMPLIRKAASSGHQENFKSVLQQHAQQRFGCSPMYQILDEKGPDHAKCFEVCVEIGGRRFASTWGSSKKQAEQVAALNALHELGVVLKEESGEVRVIGVGGGSGGGGGMTIAAGSDEGEPAAMLAPPLPSK